ncbi:MAG: T9SS type A sorting domain-containing protein [Bacteroidales bacterium]|nr:T9SS type A sorting domain-containing protein [Bacteroidales bacterium]
MMKRFLLSLSALFIGVFLFQVNAQTTLEIPIIATGGTDSVDVEYSDPDTVIWIVVPLSSDDAEQENDEIDSYFDDDLDLGWEGAPDAMNTVNLGLRFQNVTIPKGATIDSAYLILCSHEAREAILDAALITIKGEASDSAMTYDVDTFLITDRTKTTATVTWADSTAWGLYTYHKSADISSIIQEIIDRPGWNTGNPISLILTGEDQGPSDYLNSREIEAFENIADPGDGGDGQNHPERRPKLRIVYNTATRVNQYGLSRLAVYPNPARDIFHISVIDKSEISIVDITGKEVMNFVAEKNSTTTVNVSNLHSGMYFVKAVQNNNSLTCKVIVK